jgi:hypothetical protein
VTSWPPAHVTLTLGSGRRVTVATPTLRRCEACGRLFTYDGFHRITTCRIGCDGDSWFVNDEALIRDVGNL